MCVSTPPPHPPQTPPLPPKALQPDPTPEDTALAPAPNECDCGYCQAQVAFSITHRSFPVCYFKSWRLSERKLDWFSVPLQVGADIIKGSRPVGLELVLFFVPVYYCSSGSSSQLFTNSREMENVRDMKF